MSKKVRYELDVHNLPALTHSQAAEVAELKAMSESSVDFSDIAPLDDAFWENATRNPFYKPTKISTTVRLDSDVLAWLKGAGKGYQTRMNAILRQAMLQALQHKA